VLGLAILPIVTILRARQPRPTGPVGTVEHFDLASELGRESLVGTGKNAWWLRVPGNQALQLDLRDWSITRPWDASRTAQLSIFHLTDLHLCEAFDARLFHEMLRRSTKGFEPDLVLFTGDLADDHQSIDWVGDLLGQLKGRLGQFAILGNHDYRRHERADIAALRAAGFDVIEGQWRAVDFEGGRLALGGTSAPWGPPLDPTTMPAADFRIILSHSPDRFYRAVDAGADLVFSGHTHGGQYRFPVVGSVLCPSIYGRRFDEGFFEREKTLMYVSRGVAAEHPLRYGARPEISRFRINLVPRAAAAADPRSQAARLPISG
jgi:predicted MPP superfamily phosphohydrolase